MMILSGLRRFALVLIAFAAMGASPVLAEPALWAIKDEDSTIYLFGTVHVLRPTTQWRSSQIAKAFQDADDLVMEIEQPEDAATTRALMLKYGVDQAAPLS